MKRKRRRYRKGLKGFWLDGTPAYRVPILPQKNVQLSQEQQEKYDEVLRKKKHKQRKSLVGIKKGNRVILKNGIVCSVVKTTRWYIFLDNELKYWRQTGIPVNDNYESFIVKIVE